MGSERAKYPYKHNRSSAYDPSIQMYWKQKQSILYSKWKQDVIGNGSNINWNSNSKNLRFRHGSGQEMHIQELSELRPQLSWRSEQPLAKCSKAQPKTVVSELYETVPSERTGNKDGRKRERQETGIQKARNTMEKTLFDFVIFIHLMNISWAHATLMLKTHWWIKYTAWSCWHRVTVNKKQQSK